MIVKESCAALWEVLVPTVLKPPSTSKWIEIANDFNTFWQCGNCIGALDGKHIRIKCPPKSGSEFFNYKGFYSIALLAVCDAHYRFVLVDIGNSGRHSDGGVFQNSAIGKKFANQQLGIPPPNYLPGSTICIPHYFAADDAFPIKVGLIKPYPGRFLPPDNQIFNYRLCRARRVIENAFGILAVRWQVFYRMLNCDLDLAQLVVQAAVVLHNFLQTPQQQQIVAGQIFGDRTASDGTVIHGNWRSSHPNHVNILSMANIGSNFYSNDARFYRDELKRYFLTEGAVHFQWQRV